MEEQEIYGGRYKVKMTAGHRYYIAKKQKDGSWGKWESKTGVTTYGGIKDKSTPLKYWVAKLMWKFLREIIDNEKTINKFDLDKARGLHRERLEEAATTGSKIHDWIEQHTKGKKPAMPEEEAVLTGVNGFLDWKKLNKVKIVSAEGFLYSEKYDFCGTADAIATIGGKKDLYLIDYKTSNGLYNDVMMQTAAYSKAYEEETGKKIKGRWAIRLEKKTEQEFVTEMDEKGKPNAEYVPFEALYLDDGVEEQQVGRKKVTVPTGKHDPTLLQHDFDAWLNAQGLFIWNKGSEKRIDSYKAPLE